jgi:ABC-type lipoprotein export system ATPase subunit
MLSDVSLSLNPGGAAAIMGPSGSGRHPSHILGVLEPPTAGTITLDDRNPFTLDARARAVPQPAGRVRVSDPLPAAQCTVLENVLIRRLSPLR